MGRRPGFDADLADVRARLERSEGAQNLKTGPGGSYDIDYLAGSLQAQLSALAPRKSGGALAVAARSPFADGRRI